MGDPERGRLLSNTCIGCHGIPGYKNAYPTFSVPKLQHQYPEYLVLALKAYKNGERAHTTMYAQAATLTEQNMADIAAYFAGEPLTPAVGGAGPDRGPIPEAAQVCVACHGPDGIGISPLYPTLAGQYADYLRWALISYKNGTRKNAIMAGFAAALTEEQIETLAEYYSRQKPALESIDSAYAPLAADR